MTNITASAETLMRQASMTAESYLRAAVQSIDDEFGKGFAKAHPNLVASVINAAAKDFETSLTNRSLEKIADALTEISSSIREKE